MVLTKTVTTEYLALFTTNSLGCTGKGGGRTPKLRKRSVTGPFRIANEFLAIITYLFEKGIFCVAHNIGSGAQALVVVI